MLRWPDLSRTTLQTEGRRHELVRTVLAGRPAAGVAWLPGAIGFLASGTAVGKISADGRGGVLGASGG